MNNLIIIEGADCCGKTTLAKAMQQVIPNTMYWHSTASKTLFSGLADYHSNILDNVEKNPHLTLVLDRFWPSELAYGTMLFRPLSGYEKTAVMLHDRIKNIGAMYIFCFSDHGLKRYQDANRQKGSDPAHVLSDEHYRMVYRNYRRLYQGLSYDLVSLYSIEEEGKNMTEYIKRTYETLRNNK